MSINNPISVAELTEFKTQVERGGLDAALSVYKILGSTSIPRDTLG